MNYKDNPNRDEAITEIYDTGLTLLSQLRIASAQAFGSLGLTYGQAMLLFFVERGYASPSDLARRLGVVAQALASLVTALCEKDLLVRHKVEGDGRQVVIALTPQGVTACSRLKEAWWEHFPVDIHGFSDDELNQLLRAVRMVTQQKLN